MMPRIALGLCLALLAAGFCATSAEAAKYTQPPKTDLSYDFASEQNDAWAAVMADDWICPDGSPIYGIRWWGSYWTPSAPKAFTIYSDNLKGAPAGGIDMFVVYVFPNVPGGGSIPFDHPDTTNTLGEWRFNAALANENPAFTVTKPTNPTVTEDVYSYYVDLTQVMGTGPFLQQQGQKYWLLIYADHDDVNKQWGWHESDVHRGDYALQAVEGKEELGWYMPCGGHDMAFELILPEPGSICALAAGVIGLVGFAGRSRRRTP
jgi:hypothetical protein